MHDESDLVRTRQAMTTLAVNLWNYGLRLPSAAPAYLGALYVGASPAEAFEAARRQCLLELPPRLAADYAQAGQRRLSAWEVERAIAARAADIAKLRALPNPFLDAVPAQLEKAA